MHGSSVAVQDGVLCFVRAAMWGLLLVLVFRRSDVEVAVWNIGGHATTACCLVANVTVIVVGAGVGGIWLALL